MIIIKASCKKKKLFSKPHNLFLPQKARKRISVLPVWFLLVVVGLDLGLVGLGDRGLGHDKSSSGHVSRLLVKSHGPDSDTCKSEKAPLRKL